jgi:peroxiredoxin family protein
VSIYHWFRVYLYHVSWGLLRLKKQQKKRRESREAEKQKSWRSRQAKKQGAERQRSRETEIQEKSQNGKKK